MKRLFAFLFILLAGIAAVSFDTVAHAAATAHVSSTNGAIELDVGKGQLIRLQKPASSVFIANPKIADVEVKSPTLIYVFGKASGATTLYAVSDHDEILLNSEIRVHYDVARLQQTIHELVPHNAVTVTAVDDSLVLGGTVYSAAAG